MQEFNLIQTEKVEKDPKYVQYNKWLLQNGVLIDNRIRYPSAFGNTGLVGVSAKKAIERHKAIAAIPYKLIITVDKVKNTEPLGMVIAQNLDVFKIQDDSAFMILLLYVCFELMKGQKSFYHPYFQIAGSATISDWSHWDMMTIQNRQITARIKQQKQALEINFMHFLRIFRRYSSIFPEEISNTQYKKIFQRAYGLITTRAFGWSLPSISLIPFADSLNHGCKHVNHFLVDKQLQFEDNYQDYIKYKEKSNLELIDPKMKPTQQLLTMFRKGKRSRRLKFIQKHKQVLDGQPVTQNDKSEQVKKQQRHILHQQYKADVRTLRQLHFYQSSCSEDNDTDQETLYDTTYKQQTFLLDQILSKKNSQNKPLKYKIRSYWKIYEQKFLNEESDKSQQEQQPSKQQQKTKMQLKSKSSECSSSVSSTQSSQEDQESFDWIKSANLDNVYFVVQIKQITRENEQLFNFYGRRSNKFLLIGYNFVMNENVYDSYGIKFIIDPNLKIISPQKIIYNGKGKIKHTKQVRIKKQRVSTGLIHHCRCYLLQTLKQAQIPKNVSIMLAFNKQFQEKCLNLAIDIITFILKSYMTSIEQDQELLQKSYKKYESYTAILMKMNHKSILESQRVLLQKCLKFLKKSKNGKIDIKEDQMQDVEKCISYLKQIEKAKI